MRRISVVKLPVTDLERSKRFYSQGLGLKLGAEVFSPEMEPSGALFNFSGESADLQLDRVPALGEGSRNVLVAMEVEAGTNLVDLLEQLEKLGGQVKTREPRTPGLLVVTLVDPDGNYLELLIQQ